MFREVVLPDHVPGRLLLHHLPGSRESFDVAREAMLRENVSRVVCLNPTAEIRILSPGYAASMEQPQPWQQINYPIVDFSAPVDRPGFSELVATIADGLRHGEAILIHCRAGIGRTGMTANAVLRVLGVPADVAAQRVRDAGSSPESHDQQAFLDSLKQ